MCWCNKIVLIKNKTNRGISVASNQALDAIGKDYSIIAKTDNDCSIDSDNIIQRLVNVFEQEKGYFLSPNVNGLNFPPPRHNYITVAGQRVGVTGLIGGLFHCMDADMYQKFRYNEDLNLAAGQDEQVCRWFNEQGGVVGYLEGMNVSHMDTTNGQAEKYPEYFERKYREEQTRG